MKNLEIKLLLLVIGIICDVSIAHNFKDEVDEFKSYDGPKFQSIYPDPSLDVSESTYYEEDDGENRRSFRAIDPQPRVTKSFLYVSPDEVEDSLVREKRAAPPAEESEDYDYTRGYRDFVKENFGYSDEIKPLANEDYGDATTDDEYERIKELSDKENEESKKHPEFCKVVHKDGKDCTICKNPKNNAQSESCSYSSAPAPKKYAYKRERNYNSKDNDDDDNNDDDNNEDDHDEDATETKEQKLPKNEGDSSNLKKQTPKKTGNKKSSSRRESEQRSNGPDNKPKVYSSRTKTNSKKQSANPKPNEGYYDTVIQYNNAPPTSHDHYVPSNTKNVEKVLQEFKTKDWSKCKRKSKNGLTCYYCKDDAGISNEECMYVSDEKPAPRSQRAYDHSFENDDTARSATNAKAEKAKLSQRTQKRNRNIPANRRVSTGTDDSLSPVNYQEGQPTAKRTIKRMVSVEYEGTQEEEPTTNKSLYYAKKITHVTK